MDKFIKIAFIIATNDEQIYEECIFYLEQLHVRDGYEIEVIKVTDANSMAAAYNEGMKSTDARFKIYLHQDVFILNKSMIDNMLDIFLADETIGMIGVLGGVNLPDNGIMWDSWNYGKTWASIISKVVLVQGTNQILQGEIKEVEAIDGMIMMTQYDIPWREDLFTGWDFYDVSQSYEFRNRGYKVVVPYQEDAWCLHDCGHSKLQNYDDNRKIFLKEYGDVNKWEVVINKENYEYVYRIKDNLIIAMNDILRGNTDIIDDVVYIIDDTGDKLPRINELLLMRNVVVIYRCEERTGDRGFFEQVSDWTSSCSKYNYIKFMLRRVEYDMPGADRALLRLIQDGQVSWWAIVVIGIHSLQDYVNVKRITKWCYKQLNQDDISELIDVTWDSIAYK